MAPGIRARAQVRNHESAMTAESSAGAQVARVTTSALKAQAARLGFTACGVTGVLPSEHAEFLQRWLDAGRHGSMSYLAREDAVRARARPDEAWPALRTAIVLALDYHDGDMSTAQPADRGIIARYARGRDYHKVIRKKLFELLRWLEQETGRALPLARAYVDTGPVLERELAQRAGLGWFGRNTMILHPRRGSYFFLATLLVELDFDDHDEPFVADHCGTCNACVSACPTGALLGRDASGAPVIDATRCISYLTIEQRGPIPHELRPLIGNRVFGCDICQEVCPWNSPKFVQLTREPDFNGRERDRERKRKRKREQRDPLPETSLPSLISLMRLTYDEWVEWTRGSAIRRAGYAGLKRNVAVALGNWGAEEAVAVLVEALMDAEPLVRAHAAWALGRVGSAEARSALSSRASVETHESVLEELSAAMDA
jgi:epoxyqueuosine reductase